MKNKVTPLKEKRVVAMAKKNPEWHCRKIAYQLEKKATVFVGKTKVAEIMKKHGLNHLFEQNIRPPMVLPADMLLHEPWRKNLLWGMDWTWVNVGDKFIYLLVLVDWYSRKILSWSLNPTITRFEVVALVTNASAQENIDQLPKDALRPIVVADHGSANTSDHTKNNIKLLGIDLWLFGIGRPTGKNEEIKLQERDEDEDEAYERIKNKIHEYNFESQMPGTVALLQTLYMCPGDTFVATIVKPWTKKEIRLKRISWLTCILILINPSFVISFKVFMHPGSEIGSGDPLHSKIVFNLWERESALY